MIYKLLSRLCFVLAACLIFTGCLEEKDQTQTQAPRLRVLLTDGPADYEEVNIEIIDVQINPNDDNQGWISLGNVNTGVYDILTLTGGLDTLIAEDELAFNTLNQIRLILGENNTLKVDGEIKDLKTPSAQQSGLKIKINQEVEEGIIYNLILDFDAARSIVKAGNSGKFNLKPVIRARLEAESGSIQGTVTPSDFQSLVYAINGMDSLSTFTNEEGFFQIRAVPPGTYRLVVEPESTSGYNTETLNGVEVQIGQITDVGLIELMN